MKTYSNYNRVYLSMPISGYDLDERAEFANEMTAKVKLAFPNAEVIDPITLSSALNDKHNENGLEPPTYKEYMDNDFEEIGKCDAIVFAKDWDSSKGCIAEKLHAIRKQVKLFYLDYQDNVEDTYVRWKPKEVPQTCYELFGIECGEGWKKIYQPVIDEVKAYNDGKPEAEHIKINQIKEKFGGLRIYLSKYTEKLEKMIDEAEEKSFHICEYCGKPGKVRGRGWIYTLCEDCWRAKKGHAGN